MPTSALSFWAASASASGITELFSPTTALPLDEPGLAAAASFLSSSCTLARRLSSSAGPAAATSVKRARARALSPLPHGRKGRLVKAEGTALFGQSDLCEQFVGLAVDAELCRLGLLGHLPGGRIVAAGIKCLGLSEHFLALAEGSLSLPRGARSWAPVRARAWMIIEGQSGGSVDPDWLGPHGLAFLRGFGRSAGASDAGWHAGVVPGPCRAWAAGGAGWLPATASLPACRSSSGSPTRQEPEPSL